MEHKNLVNDIWDTSVHSVNKKVLLLCILFLGKLLLLSCDMKLRELRESREVVNTSREAAKFSFPAAWRLSRSSLMR